MQIEKNESEEQKNGRIYEKKLRKIFYTGFTLTTIKDGLGVEPSAQCYSKKKNSRRIH